LDPEEESNKFLQNVSSYLPISLVSYPCDVFITSGVAKLLAAQGDGLQRPS
jgi:hypothetical protein